MGSQPGLKTKRAALYAALYLSYYKPNNSSFVYIKPAHSSFIVFSQLTSQKIFVVLVSFAFTDE